MNALGRLGKCVATPPAHPSARGYHVIYRIGRENGCPGCGGSQWHVGRMTAECAYCHTALPIERQEGCQGTGLFTSRGTAHSDGLEFA